MNEQDPEQTLYEGQFESLGYRQKKQPFLKLADSAPYSDLWPAAIAVGEEHRPGAVEAWLLKLSGFVSAEEADQVILPGVGFSGTLSRREWHGFRVRLANHPRLRIGGAARLVSRFLDGGLLSGLARCADANNPEKPTDALTVIDRGTTYIGASRTKEMAVNVVLPFLHGLTVMQGEAGHAARYLASYHKFGKLPNNEITREMSEQLINPAWRKVATTARRQQGLIHLKRLLSGEAS